MRRGERLESLAGGTICRSRARRRGGGKNATWPPHYPLTVVGMRPLKLVRSGAGLR